MDVGGGLGENVGIMEGLDVFPPGGMVGNGEGGIGNRLGGEKFAVSETNP